MDEVKIRPAPPPLPAAANQWLRIVKEKRTLNDLVEELHFGLADDPDYIRHIAAVWDEDAVEGKQSIDDVCAAQLIRKLAQDRESEVGKKNVATIIRALHVVLDRFGQGRGQRRRMVQGEQVKQMIANGEQ